MSDHTHKLPVVKFMTEVLEAMAKDKDLATAAMKLKNNPDEYLKSKQIAVPAGIDPNSVEYIHMHNNRHHQHSGSTIHMMMPDGGCDSSKWTYLGSTSEKGVTTHWYINECGSLAKCQGH